MTKINNIDFTKLNSDLKPVNQSNQSIEIFPSGDCKKNVAPEIEELPESVKKAFRFMYILNNQELLNDDVLLIELNEIIDNDLNVIDILENYRLNNDGGGLLDQIKELDNIKSSTKEKIFNYFKRKLTELYAFDAKYSNNCSQTKFKYEDYEYNSDRYSVTQKGDDVLEVVNLDTNEKRTINLNDIIPSQLNGLNDIIALKSVIQKLPGELLFQLPEEVSIIWSHDSMVSSSIEKVDPNNDIEVEIGVEEELESPFDKEDGAVRHLENDFEFLSSDFVLDTMIHEIAHTIFLDKEGNETLENNEQLVEIFNKGSAKYREERNYSDETCGYLEEGYWSESISELGAEIINALYTHNTTILDSINQYAPGAIPIVIDIYKERLKADDKHLKFDVDSFIEYLDENSK